MGVFAEIDAAAASLQTDSASAGRIQSLGDELLSAIHDQSDSLDEYLLSADPRPLARFHIAVASEASIAARIGAGSGNLQGITDALNGVDSENTLWRATVAGPAIAAVAAGSRSAIATAIEAQIVDNETAQVTTSAFVAKIDALQIELARRSDLLDGLRLAAAGLAIAAELAAAALSLWFVHRYGRTVAADVRRRERQSAERVDIVASLRSLRTRETPEATASVIAEALVRLPGVDVAGVFECDGGDLVALAITGLPGFPIQTGESIPADRARYLLGRSANGPWAERWTPTAEPSGYGERLSWLGIKSQAYAPIQANGELVGMIAIATTDEAQGRHLVEDLPAISEFASLAEAILAPALLARRGLASERRRIGSTIESAAYQPVFQPIIELSSGDTAGFEALTRFDDGTRPDVVFASALECGLGLALETATLGAAIREADDLPTGAWLSLNVSPGLLSGGSTLGRLVARTSRPIVLEITEHEVITAYAPLRDAMRLLGPRVRLAVDDAGAGVANFNHLVELRPDFLKIDIGLVRGVDRDPSRRAVVVGLVHFAAEAGCQVLAEGIETEAERLTVMELGVTLGQGYILGRPAPASSWRIVASQRSKPKRRVRPVGRSGLPVPLPVLPLPAVRLH
jgi:EAL domain-containing protein (putative c-di-GMP-specific phosphodiesterase class I)